jgi:molybdopterin converting factor small subunit
MTQSVNITVYVPRQLRTYCEGSAELSISAPTVRAALEEIERRFPSLYGSICDETAAVRRHLNLFVNSSHVRDLQGLDTALKSGDEIMVFQAVSGG